MGRLVIALLCLGLSGCREERLPASARREVPIFIVSIDSLRADRLPAYGYAGGRTPIIDAFRREAILYRWAFSNCPQTLPSHASILTGTLPPAHGVRDNEGYRLSSAAPTIATRLRKEGFATGAAVSSYTLRRETGIGEGFDFYDDRVAGSGVRPTMGERDGEETRLALTSWLEVEGAPGRRLFGFLHLHEPHAPYAAPREFRQVTDDYDNEIAYADDVIGRFLETLRQRVLYDDSLIIILSDHGEGLGDHGEDEHGLFVYRESIHVPLLVKLPRAERGGETVTRPVSLHQIAELVLSVARGSRTAALLASTSSAAPIYSESYYPRLHFGWSELRSIIAGDRHFIDAPAQELYNFVADPAEVRNLAGTDRGAAASMLASARAIDIGFTPPSGSGLEARARFEAAGEPPGRRTRADPKDKVQVVRDLSRAIRFFEARRYRDAIPLLERVVFNEPAIVDGWAMLGRSRAAARQHGLAIEAYGEGLRRFPRNAELALLIATEYANAGDWAAATRHAEAIATDDPVLAHEALARFAARRGDLNAARVHAETALRHAPGRVPALMILAEISRRASRPAEQLMWLDRAAHEVASRATPKPRDLDALRGDALMALGRSAEAEAAYRSEVTHFPHNEEAWRKLAVLVGSDGRRDAARAIIANALRANDTASMRAMARDAFETIGDREGLATLEGKRGRT